MNHTPLPYYLVTGIFVLIVATGFPPISPWVINRLDHWFFRTEHKQQQLARYLAETLAEAPDPTQLQVELLETLRNILNVGIGYLAVSTPDLPNDKLVVQLGQGNLHLQPGDLIRRPPLHSKEPQLVAALLPQASIEPNWQGTALFCPLTLDDGLEGILALGEKRNKAPFSLPDLLFCAELIKQLGPFRRTRRRWSQHPPDHQAAQLQEQTLRRLSATATAQSSQTLITRENQTAPIEIRVLGPLQVSRQGQLIPERAWGSEKAKGMLAYLLWKNPAGVTREELSEALWPGRSADETANVFHVTLHRLRRVLQAEPSCKDLSYILHERGYYRFNLEAPHWLDVTVFQSLVIGDNPTAWQAAVSLYRGAYLEDMAWVLPIDVEAKRQRLEQLYADTLRRLAAQANEREALLYLERLLAVEPADETTHRALALGYLARGRADLARRQVERWQQALVEFGLDVSAETELFWQTMKFKNNEQP
jgi:DNA-binding SARP family transcriptional activator